VPILRNFRQNKYEFMPIKNRKSFARSAQRLILFFAHFLQVKFLDWRQGFYQGRHSRKLFTIILRLKLRKMNFLTFNMVVWLPLQDYLAIFNRWIVCHWFHYVNFDFFTTKLFGNEHSIVLYTEIYFRHF